MDNVLQTFMFSAPVTSTELKTEARHTCTAYFVDKLENDKTALQGKQFIRDSEL